MKRKLLIAVLTSARADYGILRSLLSAISLDRDLKLRLYVTGSHLDKKYGHTGKVVEEEFKSSIRKIKTTTGQDSLVEAASVLGRGSIEFAKEFKKERPDIFVIVGDRFEILGPVAAAVIFGIPVAHIHGGERTDGAVDEFIRHSVTKLSTFHFTTTERYRQRVIQLGENPRNVWYVGAPGLDQVKSIKFYTKSELSKKLNLDLSKPTAISTFHPETRSNNLASCKEMISAIIASGIQCIFSAPNADPGNQLIIKEINQAVKTYPSRFKLVRNLGTEAYLSAIKHCGVMIGNSSSGIIEAPSLGAAIVNIGDRQSGRVRSRHVIDVKHKKADILKGIKKAFSPSFKKSLKTVKNPYEPINKTLTGIQIKNLIKKIKIQKKPPFFDLKRGVHSG